MNYQNLVSVLSASAFAVKWIAIYFAISLQNRPYFLRILGERLVSVRFYFTCTPFNDLFTKTTTSFGWLILVLGSSFRRIANNTPLVS